VIMLPTSFAEDLMTDWGLWVLDHGLPELPATVEIGESVPVARWVGPRFASVLHVQWMWSDDHHRDYLASEVEVFVRTASGWDASDAIGGTSWFDPPLQRPSWVGPRDARIVGQHCSGSSGWSCRAVYGLAGDEAAFIEVIDARGVIRRPFDSAEGAFVACSDATETAEVRVLARDGTALTVTAVV
jgi:hypothetical protein